MSEKQQSNDRAEFWRQVLLDAEESPLSLAQFLLQRNLCRTSYYRFKRKLFPKAKTGTQSPVANNIVPFSRVIVSPTTQQQISCRLSFPQGVSVDIESPDAGALLLQIQKNLKDSI